MPYTETEPMPVKDVGPGGADVTAGIDAMTAKLDLILAAVLDTTAVVVADGGGSLTVDGVIRIPTANFTRPTDTNAYVAGDLIANNTAAASVTLPSWTVAGSNGGSGMVRKARLKKSTASVTNASFRLHLFTVIPTVATTGDNGVVTTVVTGVASYVGAFDITVDRAFADGSVGAGAPHTGSEGNFVCAAGDTKLYGVLEALAGYTPGNAEVFTIELEVVANT